VLDEAVHQILTPRCRRRPTSSTGPSVLDLLQEGEEQRPGLAVRVHTCRGAWYCSPVAFSATPAPDAVAPRPATAPSSRLSLRDMPNLGPSRPTDNR